MVFKKVVSGLTAAVLAASLLVTAGSPANAEPINPGDDCVFRSPYFDYYGSLAATQGTVPMEARVTFNANWSWNEYVDPNTGEYVWGPPPTFSIKWGDGSSDVIPSQECLDHFPDGSPASPFRNWRAQTMNHVYATRGDYTVEFSNSDGGHYKIGVVTVSGPDADGDGVDDPDDHCVDQAGPASNNGCPVEDPDRDGDEVPNDVDACPDEPGEASNNGCPVPVPPLVVDGEASVDANGTVYMSIKKLENANSGFSWTLDGPDVDQLFYTEAPSWTVGTNGRYTATLTACQFVNHTITCSIDAIEVKYVNADFYYEQAGDSYRTQRFTPLHSTSGEQHRWLVDGEQVSTEREFEYTFPRDGTFEVTLELVDGADHASSTRSVVITPLTVVADNTGTKELFTGSVVASSTPSGSLCNGVEAKLRAHSNIALWLETEASGFGAGVLPDGPIATAGFLPPNEDTDYVGCFHTGDNYVQLAGNAFSDGALALDAVEPMFELLSVTGTFHDAEVISRFRAQSPVEFRNLMDCTKGYIGFQLSPQDAWGCQVTNFMALLQRPAAMDELVAATAVLGDLYAVQQFRAIVDGMRNVTMNTLQTLEKLLQSASRAATYEDILGRVDTRINGQIDRTQDRLAVQQMHLGTAAAKRDAAASTLDAKRAELARANLDLGPAKARLDDAVAHRGALTEELTAQQNIWTSNHCNARQCPDLWTQINGLKTQIKSANLEVNAATKAVNGLLADIGALPGQITRAEEALSAAEQRVQTWLDTVSDTTDELNFLKQDREGIERANNFVQKLLVFWEQAKVMRAEADLLRRGRTSGNAFFIACDNTSASPACTG